MESEKAMPGILRQVSSNGTSYFILPLLDTCRRMPGIAFSLSMSWGYSFERQSSRDNVLANRQSHSHYSIAICDVSRLPIDGSWQFQIAVIDSNAPLIKQEFFDIL